MNRFPMKTFQQDAILARLSQALVALEVGNVKTLTSEQCEKLQCGDVVVKKDSSGEHSYVVTFKSDTGMCLTYMDASVIETQSYDKVGNAWIYNSEDKTPNLLNAQTENDVKALIEGGTVDNAKPIYFHPVTIRNYNIGYIAFVILDNNPEAYTKDTLPAKIAEFNRIAPLSGAIKKVVEGVTSTLILAYAYKDGNKHVCLGLQTNGTAIDSQEDYHSIEDILSATITTVSDGVNKIN